MMKPEQKINQAIDNLKIRYMDRVVSMRGHANVWDGRKEVLLKLDVLHDIRREIKAILEEE